MSLAQDPQETLLLQEARERLQRLSLERLRVAADFLAYLEEKEENEATEELLKIPGFLERYREAMRQADAGEVVSFDSIGPNVLPPEKYLQIQPAPYGSGYTDTSINHDSVVTDPSAGRKS